MPGGDDQPSNSGCFFILDGRFHNGDKLSFAFWCLKLYTLRQRSSFQLRRICEFHLTLGCKTWVVTIVELTHLHRYHLHTSTRACYCDRRS